MRHWSLGMGDPLSLILAADFRQGGVDFSNDQIWELALGGGDPPAMAVQTTFGLRARSMRIFPRFCLGRESVTNPAEFHVPPRLCAFTPSFLLLEFSPFPGIEITAEYWVPSSQTLAGRLTMTSKASAPLTLQLDLCGQLSPISGQSLGGVEMQAVHVLAGRTSGLAPVIFLTGGPLPGTAPYPSLTIDSNLAPGASRQLTWVHAALGDPQASFDLARRTATRPWDAERTRLEFTHASQTLEIQTGDPDWDAAFALSQRTAFSLFYPPDGRLLPQASCYQGRSPDNGYLPPGKWLGRAPLPDGLSAVEAYCLAGLLPGVPGLMEGIVQNFLSRQEENGQIPDRPGLAGQHGRWLATPLLATQAWKRYEASQDLKFIEEVYPRLLAYHRTWFLVDQDRDQDGFPEWSHPLQTGVEDLPLFNLWHEWGQGADISVFESPGLAAMLCAESRALSRMAGLLGDPVQVENLESQASKLQAAVEECWDAEAAIYRMRDRDTHQRPAWQVLGSQVGNGKLELKHAFQVPCRLLVRLHVADTSCRPKVILRGRAGGQPVKEELLRADFQWGSGWATYTTRHCYTRFSRLDVRGVGPRDEVRLSVLGFNSQDQTLFLPMWAGIPHPSRAQELVTRSLMNPERYYHPYGISAYPLAGLEELLPRQAEADAVRFGVHMPWCQLFGEGLLSYGMRAESAELVSRLMAGVIQNLKKWRAFYGSYHADSGAGMGQQNVLSGLAPLGLFLQTLGVCFLDEKSVRLEGQNPFPWPVTIRSGLLRVTRHANRTEVGFPDGQVVTVEDSVPCVVTNRLEE